MKKERWAKSVCIVFFQHIAFKIQKICGFCVYYGFAGVFHKIAENMDIPAHFAALHYKGLAYYRPAVAYFCKGGEYFIPVYMSAARRSAAVFPGVEAF